MALSMEQVAEVCRLHAQGWSITAIAAHCGLDRKTVRKYLEQESFSPSPPAPVPRPSKLDPFKAEIQQWLAEDAKVRYKQRHTAVRIWERLRAAYPETFTCSYNVVQRYVQQLRHQAAASANGALELVWHSGEAQVDFGEADGWTADGQALVFHYLVMTFPYSNMGWVQAFRGETAECIVQGLQDIFQACGGVPRRLVFDQASGVGRRWGETLRLTELFARFQAHYGFAVTLCNPNAGHEKGNVENFVGTWRRHAFVPPPVIADWAAFNADLLRQSAARQTRTHYKKGVPLATLWAEDRAACLALPRAPFAPVRYTRVRTDGYGKFCLDGVHWYSTAPEYANQTVWVGIGAHTVIPLTPAGRPIVTHVRQFGTTRTDSVDARTTVHRLWQNPGAWRNSALREQLPAAVRAALDQASRTERKETLHALAECTDRFGWDHAVRALEAALAQARLAYSHILVLATQMAVGPQPPAAGPDLTVYDRFLPQGGGLQ